MKYFLCAFDAAYLGIPSECTQRVISVSRKQLSVCETEEQHIFISLPLLFGRADISAPHGIVLKENKEKQITLLAPLLDIDYEIPDENIFTVPKAIGAKLRYLKGACFIKKDREERPVYIVDIEKLMEDFT
jgi:hypothetical protein